MICNKCGTQNNDNSRFCIGCGSTLTAVQESVISSFNYQSLNNEQEVNNVGSNGIFNNDQVYNNVNISTMNNQLNNSIVNEQLVANNVSEQPVNNTVVNQSMTSVQKINKEKKPLNKKLLLIIGISLVVVIILTVVLLFWFGGDKNAAKNLSNIFDLDQPIPVYKDGSYVYIDTSGKTIKNIKYNQVSDFRGDYAYVELEDGTAALIDKNQNVKVTATSYYGMEYIYDYDLWLIDEVLYDGKLKPITDSSISLSYEENGFFTYSSSNFAEYGIVNSSGRKVYKSDCLITSLEINSSSFNDEYYAIVENTCYNNDVSTKKEYLVSLQTGKVLYENKYRDAHPESSYYYSLRTDYNNIFYIVDDNYDNIKYLYLLNDEIVYESTEILYDLTLYGSEYLQIDYGYDYEELSKEQRYYYYNLENKKLEKEEPEFEEVKIEKDVTQRQRVRCDNGYGLIDDKNVIIPCIYEDIEYLENNVYEYMKQVKSMELMLVENEDNVTSVYDATHKKNLIVFEKAENYNIDGYNNSLLMTQKIYTDGSYWSSELEQTIVYNLLTGKSIKFDVNSDIEIKSNYFIESKNGKRFYYNMNFEKIYTEA